LLCIEQVPTPSLSDRDTILVALSEKPQEPPAAVSNLSSEAARLHTVLTNIKRHAAEFNALFVNELEPWSHPPEPHLTPFGM